MAARSFAAPLAIEDVARAALARARPSLEEILSLWPADRHDRIVLWARLGAGGEIAVGAHLRGHTESGAARTVTRDPPLVRGEIPVVLELEEGSKLVVSLRTRTRSESR